MVQFDEIQEETRKTQNQKAARQGTPNSTEVPTGPLQKAAAGPPGDVPPQRGDHRCPRSSRAPGPPAPPRAPVPVPAPLPGGATGKTGACTRARGTGSPGEALPRQAAAARKKPPPPPEPARGPRYPRETLSRGRRSGRAGRAAAGPAGAGGGRGPRVLTKLRAPPLLFEPSDGRCGPGPAPPGASAAAAAAAASRSRCCSASIFRLKSSRKLPSLAKTFTPPPGPGGGDGASPSSPCASILSAANAAPRGTPGSARRWEMTSARRPSGWRCLATRGSLAALSRPPPDRQARRPIRRRGRDSAAGRRPMRARAGRRRGGAAEDGGGGGRVGAGGGGVRGRARRGAAGADAGEHYRAEEPQVDLRGREGRCGQDHLQVRRGRAGPPGVGGGIPPGWGRIGPPGQGGRFNPATLGWGNRSRPPGGRGDGIHAIGAPRGGGRN